MMLHTITIPASPANDNAHACPCGAPAGRDGLCPACIAEYNAHLDATRFYVADDEGEALAGGFDVSDSLRFID